MKYLIIFFVIFLTIAILLFFNYMLKNSDKINKLYNINNIEKFSSICEKKSNNENNNENNNYPNNLIINGNFENGSNIKNHLDQSGYNKIILKKNPGKSPYVLEQKKNNDNTLTYYEIFCNCENNTKYVMYFWFSVLNNNTMNDTMNDKKNNKYNIENINFENLLKIKIQNEDFSNYIPNIKYNIIEKINISNDNNTWYLLKYDFYTGNSTKNKMQIYLNYNENLIFDYYYFTNISLYKVLIDAENFIYNDKLICYTDGYKYESNIVTWHDLSGNGNDLFFSSIPDVDNTKGKININNLKINGFSSNKLLNKEFTCIFIINKDSENTNLKIVNNIDIFDEESNNDNNNEILKSYLLSIPGNDMYAFEIALIDDYIYLFYGNNIIKSDNKIILYNKTLISISYDKNNITIYQDGVSILSTKIPNIYLNENSIFINRNKNLNINLYGVLFYNKIVKKNELNNIREYFIKENNKNTNTLNINSYLMNDNNQNLSANNYLFQGFNKRMDRYESVENDIFKYKFDNQNYKIKGAKENCIKDCSNLCKEFLEENNYNIDKYNKCIKTCKNVLLSCENYCNDDENKDKVYCKKNDIIIKKNPIECPKVYKKNGNYYVYVTPNSYYANILKYSGEKSYGNNLDKARYTYNLNFPLCSTPNELLPGEGKIYLNTCPYIINESNPCYTSGCAGVNWDVKNYKDLNLNKKCKKSVSNYCQLNYNIDENCKCWDPKNKNDSKCIDFRRYFEDPNDYCSPSQFKIDEHPDFNKYIKKDNIPCWGCDLK